MAWFKIRTAGPFRVRSKQRDDETDVQRIAKLCGFLDDFRTAITRERDGLRARHESTMERAAFSQQSLENDRPDPAMSLIVDELTDAMMRYEARLRTLERQLAFVTEMRDWADRFPLENGAICDCRQIAGSEHINPRS